VVYKELDGSVSTNYIDLYKRSCFVLEAKQGSNPIHDDLFALAAPYWHVGFRREEQHGSIQWWRCDTNSERRGTRTDRKVRAGRSQLLQPRAKLIQSGIDFLSWRYQGDALVDVGNTRSLAKTPFRYLFSWRGQYCVEECFCQRQYFDTSTSDRAHDDDL
jgi:hypothetical protein